MALSTLRKAPRHVPIGEMGMGNRAILTGVQKRTIFFTSNVNSSALGMGENVQQRHGSKEEVARTRSSGLANSKLDLELARTRSSGLNASKQWMVRTYSDGFRGRVGQSPQQQMSRTKSFMQMVGNATSGMGFNAVRSPSMGTSTGLSRTQTSSLQFADKSFSFFADLTSRGSQTIDYRELKLVYTTGQYKRIPNAAGSEVARLLVESGLGHSDALCADTGTIEFTADQVKAMDPLRAVKLRELKLNDNSEINKAEWVRWCMELKQRYADNVLTSEKTTLERTRSAVMRDAHLQDMSMNRTLSMSKLRAMERERKSQQFGKSAEGMRVPSALRSDLVPELERLDDVRLSKETNTLVRVKNGFARTVSTAEAAESEEAYLASIDDPDLAENKMWVEMLQDQATPKRGLLVEETETEMDVSPGGHPGRAWVNMVLNEEVKDQGTTTVQEPLPPSSEMDQVVQIEKIEEANPQIRGLISRIQQSLEMQSKVLEAREQPEVREAVRNLGDLGTDSELRMTLDGRLRDVRTDRIGLSAEMIGRTGMGARGYSIGGTQIPEAVIGRTGMGVRKYSFSGISGGQYSSTAGVSIGATGSTLNERTGTTTSIRKYKISAGESLSEALS